MKVKVVKQASQSLVSRVDAKGITVQNVSHKISPTAIKALKREKCSDSDIEQFNKIREEHFTAGTMKYFIPKQMTGAETNAKRRSDAHLSLISEKERKKQQRSMHSNPYCIHGRTYQTEAASVYSALTGATLVSIGCLVGPLEKEGNFPEVPAFISGTLDYIDLYSGIIVEVKCPQRIHKNWKQLYWAQGQIQMQLARCETLHIFQYIPPMRDTPGQCQINIMKVNHEWFEKIKIPLLEKARLLPAIFSGH